MSVRQALMAMIAGSALALGCGGDVADCDCPATPPRGCVYTGRQGCACAAMVCSDIGPVVDLGSAAADVGTDAPPDAGPDGSATLDVGTDGSAAADVGIDVGFDVGQDGSATADAGIDVGFDVGFDSGRDAGFDIGFDVGRDAGFDAGRDAGFDVGHDAGFDAGRDAGFDVGSDAGRDTGFDVGFDLGRDAGFDVPGRVCAIGPMDRGCAFDSDCVIGIYMQNCVGEQRAVAYNGRAAGEFRSLEACWSTVVADMLIGPCPDRLSRGIEVEQTNFFVSDSGRLGASCVAGRCTVFTR